MRAEEAAQAQAISTCWPQITRFGFSGANAEYVQTTLDPSHPAGHPPAERLLACSLAPGGNQENVMTVLAGSELRDLEHSYLRISARIQG